MKQVEYYAVTSDYDRSSTLVGYFSSKELAEEVKGKDMYRSISNLQLFTVFDSIVEFETHTRDKIRERALAKLTTEEKIALGLRA